MTSAVFPCANKQSLSEQRNEHGGAEQGPRVERSNARSEVEALCNVINPYHLIGICAERPAIALEAYLKCLLGNPDKHSNLLNGPHQESLPCWCGGSSPIPQPHYSAIRLHPEREETRVQGFSFTGLSGSNSRSGGRAFLSFGQDWSNTTRVHGRHGVRLLWNPHGARAVLC